MMRPENQIVGMDLRGVGLVRARTCGFDTASRQESGMLIHVICADFSFHYSHRMMGLPIVQM